MNVVNMCAYEVWCWSYVEVTWLGRCEVHILHTTHPSINKFSNIGFLYVRSLLGCLLFLYSMM